MVRGLAALAVVGCLALPAQAAQVKEVTVLEFPDRGERVDPVFPAMGLVLSGLSIYFWSEKIWKK